MKAFPQERAVALVIVLAFVVLLTGLVVAFLSRAIPGVQSSNTSANTTRADLFCQGSVDQIIGDLKQEIAAGSTIVSRGTTNIYLPMGNGASRQNILPYPVNSLNGNTCASLTLVKESLSGQPFFAGSTYNSTNNPVTYTPSNRASSALSTTASANGRAVSLARWNKPLLLPVTSDTNAAPTTATNFQAPNWIYVARDGSNPTAYVSNTATSGSDNALATNNAYVVGRYAYTVYDESALLDVNAAGYPSGMTAGQITAKGSPGLADLTQLGLEQSEVDALVGWRNYASAQPPGTFPSFNFPAANPATVATPEAINYFDLLMGIPAPTATPVLPITGTSTTWEGIRKTGFLTVSNQNLYNSQSDRHFNSRQELIRMLLHDVVAQTPSDRTRVKTALQYLGTFSRTLNTPSWLPVTPSGSAVAYASKAFQQAQVQGTSATAPANQIAPGVLVTTSFTRDDGTVAQVGESLIKYRFPLRRLEYFNTANQTTSGLTLVKKYFCLVPITSNADPTGGPVGTWKYVDPDTGVAAITPPTIKTLGQVALAGREPTFWEMLQTAILSGSIGDGSTGTHIFDTSNDLVPVRHLLQIGLNIVDQYNTNITPTVISFGTIVGAGSGATTPPLVTAIPIAGVKNLPYIFEMVEQDFPTVLSTATPKPTSYTYDGYMQFLLWNPHSNAGTAALNFRIVSYGTHELEMFNSGFSYDSPAPKIAYPYGSTVSTTGSSANAIAFSTTNKHNFSSIDVLLPSDAPNAVNGRTAYGSTQVGFFLGQLTNNYNPPQDKSGGTNVQIWDFPKANPADYICYRLEVQDPSGNWVPYQIIANWDDNGTVYQNNGVTNNNPPLFDGLSAYMNSSVAPYSNKFDGQLIYAFSDPRTTRFGMSDSNTVEKTLKANSWSTVSTGGSSVALGTGAATNFTPSSGYRPGSWAYNIKPAAGNSTQYYAAGSASGTDNIVRMGDGNINLPAASGHPLTNAGSPTVTNTARPYFLGRSFNSVAEMGYAGRDEPWKTLDFYSATSADSAVARLL